MRPILQQADQPVSRRVFLAIGTVILLPLATGVVWALQHTRYDFGLAAKLERLSATYRERRYRDTPLAQAIREHYDYLDLAPGTVEQFVEAYLAPGARLDDRPSVMDGLDRFLLSTDFFLNGADEAKTVHFRLLYSPMANPCYRPFPVS